MNGFFTRPARSQFAKRKCPVFSVVGRLRSDLLRANEPAFEVVATGMTLEQAGKLRMQLSDGLEVLSGRYTGYVVRAREPAASNRKE